MHRRNKRIVRIQNRDAARLHSFDKLGLCLSDIFYGAEMLDVHWPERSVRRLRPAA